MIYVLVTRPLEAAQQLGVLLDAQDLRPIVMPLYTFSACQPTRDLSMSWSATTRNLAVFTSPRAVQFGLPHIDVEQLIGLEFAVVGSATRKKLESSGYQVQLQADSGYTSEDLLRVPELGIDPGNAVIFCAPDGREALAEGLAELGWTVFKAMVYERLPLLPAAEQVDALLNCVGLISVWTSVSSINLAREHLPETVWDKIMKAPALVISARIQHHLHQLGAKHVELADGPGNPELLQSILRLGRQLNLG